VLGVPDRPYFPTAPRTPCQMLLGISLFGGGFWCRRTARLRCCGGFCRFPPAPRCNGRLVLVEGSRGPKNPTQLVGGRLASLGGLGVFFATPTTPPPFEMFLFLQSSCWLWVAGCCGFGLERCCVGVSTRVVRVLPYCFVFRRCFSCPLLSSLGRRILPFFFAFPPHPPHVLCAFFYFFVLSWFLPRFYVGILVSMFEAG